jgi:hypothetical protein
LGIPRLGLNAARDDRVPVAIRFGLVSGYDLKRERFVVLERRSAVTPIVLTKAIVDPAVAKRAFDAMMTMKKIGIAAIEAARRG